MFTIPFRHTRLTSLEEVMKFSFLTDSRATPLTYCQNNGQIAFANRNGNVYVTPYRAEIHSILEESGYNEGSIFVPFSNGEKRPESYRWLVKIAEQENWAKTCEEAFRVASIKEIQPVKVSGKYQIKEIYENSYYDDTNTNTVYRALATKFLLGQSVENIGTYILVDDKTVVVCDEYGRTFLIKAKTVVNDLVNSLLDAGYTRTVNPELYIKGYTPNAEAK